MIKEIMDMLGYMPKKEHEQITDDLSKMLSLNISENETLKNKLEPFEKRLSLGSFKSWFDNNKVIITKLHTAATTRWAKTKWVEVNTTQPLHSFLCSEYGQKELEKNFSTVVERNIDMYKKFHTPDTLVYETNTILDEIFRPSLNYVSDLTKNKYREFWDNPLYISRKVLNNESYKFDCEDYSILKYWILKISLRLHNMQEHEWRLWCNFCETLGEGLHVNLAWVKGDSGESGIIPIESTYYPQEFQRDWYNDLWLLKQRVYKNIVCFNDMEEWKI